LVINAEKKVLNKFLEVILLILTMKAKKGEGATFSKDNNIPDHINCLPFSNFAAYKNAKHGVIAF